MAYYRLPRKDIITQIKDELCDEFMEFLEKYTEIFEQSDYFLNYEYSSNINITMDIIEYNPHIRWDWKYGVSLNPNLTIEMILKHPDKDWNWFWVSQCENMTLNIIENNINLPWDWTGISFNPNITIEFIEKFYNKGWSWYGISKNSNITLGIIEKHPEKPWVLEGIHNNPNLTTDYIIKHIDEFKELHCLRCLRVSSRFSGNPNLTADILEKFPHYPWEWNFIFSNPNIKLDTILKYTQQLDEKKIYYTRTYCRNSSITMDIIEKHPEIVWEMPSICYNPNLTFDFIERNINKLTVSDFETIIQNPLNYTHRYLEKLRKHMCAFRIQCYWRKCYYDPNYTVCKKRLVREWEELSREYKELRNKLN